MAGFTPDEGEAVIASQVVQNVTTDRGTNLTLGLFNTLSTDDETITEATISKITSNLDANTKTLTDGNWTGSLATRTYNAAQVFTATGTVNDLRGYYIATTGTTPRLIVVERDSSGPYTLNTNDTYTVTPSITIS